MSASVETITTTTKKQKLNNGSPLSTMSVPNPTPTLPATATAVPAPAPATPAPATANGVQPPTQAQWAQIPIDPALQNTQPYPTYTWPPQPTGAPAPVPSPAPVATPAATPQPIRAKPSTPAPTTASPAPATTTATTATAAPGTTTAPYAAPYYTAAPGYRYPYPYQGQPQYAYAYAQAPGGQYYAVPQPVPQPQAATTATTGTGTPTAGRVVMPTAASASAAAAATSTAQAVAGVGQPVQGQQPTSALNDALAGIVDLRAEEDALARSHQDVGSAYYHREGDRSKRIGPALEHSKIWMSERLKAILSAQGLTNLPEEALNYAMLAWKARLQMLWDKALAAAEHRYSSQYSRAPSFWNAPATDGSAPSSIPATPMWSTVVKRDVGKQLSALERAEKEEETRARRERRTAAAQAEADDAMDEDEDGRKAKKMRALGPGVTARMMPEDVKKKMSDNTANRAAGLGTGKYAWMTAGAGVGAPAATAVAKPKPAASTTPAATPAPAATTATAATPKAGGWGRAYAAVSKSTAAEPKDEGVTVTLRDALFVASRERGFGGGRGSGVATAGKWE